MYGSKPYDYQLAIEEAILAENGYAQSAIGSGEEVLPVADEAEPEEATGSNQESECCTIQQACFYLLLSFLSYGSTISNLS